MDVVESLEKEKYEGVRTKSLMGSEEVFESCLFAKRGKRG